MKRKILSMLLVSSMLATMLVGCGSKEVTNDAGTTNELAGDDETGEPTDESMESGEESTDSAFETSRTDFNFIQTPFYDREVVYRDHFVYEVMGDSRVHYVQSYISPESSHYQVDFESRGGYLCFEVEGPSDWFNAPSEGDNSVTCLSENGEMLYWSAEKLGQDENSYFKNMDMEAMSAQNNWEEYESASDENKFSFSIKNFTELNGTTYNGYMLFVDNYNTNNRYTIFYGADAGQNISNEEIKEKFKTIQIVDAPIFAPSWYDGYMGSTFENGILENYATTESLCGFYNCNIANYEDKKGNPVEFCYSYNGNREDTILNFIDNTFDVTWNFMETGYRFRATYLDKIGSVDDWSKYNQMRTLENWTALLDSDEHYDEDFASRNIADLTNPKQLVDYCNKVDADSTEMGNIEVMFPITLDDGSKGYAYFIVDAEVSGAVYKFTCVAGPNESGDFAFENKQVLATLNTSHPHDTTIVNEK